MLDLKAMRAAVFKGMGEYLGIKIIHSDQTAKAPAYPYGTGKATTPAGENNGTYQQHEDGIDRLMVPSTWSFSFLSDDPDESIMLATKAREWITHSGRMWLSEHGITVQRATNITNRDTILTVEYERKNGFDVVFYVFDEVKNPAGTYGYIESAEIAHERIE